MQTATETRNGLNIVIVDDTPFDLHQMVRLVETIDGARPHGFLRMTDALGWCGKDEASLVIVDYLMPGQDGLDFVRQLRGDPRHEKVPIFLVTGFDEPRARKLAAELGIREVFTKPVDAAQFVEHARRTVLGDSPEAPQTEKRAPGPSQYAMEQEVITKLFHTLRLRDPATGLRASRVAHYSRLIGAGLGLARADQQTLFRAVPLVDIGKIGMPDSILTKGGRLTLEEYELAKKHALDGYLLLRDSALPVVRSAAEIALSHHEKWDGSGYPRGLRQKAIPLMARIAAVADVFAAVTTERPYGEAWTLEEGRELVRRASGIHFDPVCVEAFLESWEQILAIQDYFGPGEVPENARLSS